MRPPPTPDAFQAFQPPTPGPSQQPTPAPLPPMVAPMAPTPIPPPHVQFGPHNVPLDARFYGAAQFFTAAGNAMRAIPQLQHQIAQQNQAIAKLQEDNDGLQATLNATHGEKSETQTALDVARSENEDLRAQVASLTDEKNRQAQELQVVHSHLTMSRVLQRSTEEALGAAQMGLRDSQAQRGALAAEVSTTKAALASVGENLASVTRELNSTREALQAAESALANEREVWSFIDLDGGQGAPEAAHESPAAADPQVS